LGSSGFFKQPITGQGVAPPQTERSCLIIDITRDSICESGRLSHNTRSTDFCRGRHRDRNDNEAVRNLFGDEAKKEKKVAAEENAPAPLVGKKKGTELFFLGASRTLTGQTHSQTFGQFREKWGREKWGQIFILAGEMAGEMGSNLYP
jgi:hypothetical protein